MESKGVQLHLGNGAKEFTDVAGQVNVMLNNDQSLVADLVVLAIGVKPTSKLALETSKPGIPFVSHAEEKLAEMPDALKNA